MWYGNFAGQTNLSIDYYFPFNKEIFRRETFTNLHSMTIKLSIRPVNALTLYANVGMGRTIYCALNPKAGHGYAFSVGATVKPILKLQLDLSYNYSTLSSLNDQTRFYSGSISRLEVRYTFIRHLFFRLITQYNSFNKQLQVYPLIYYKLNPFTKVYLGMTDNLQHVNRLGPPRINGYRQSNREFFIKFQYLIQK